MREEADQFIAEMEVILKEKWRIDITTPETFGICKDEYNNSVQDLKDAIREVFKFYSYNGW